MVMNKELDHPLEKAEPKTELEKIKKERCFWEGKHYEKESCETCEAIEEAWNKAKNEEREKWCGTGKFSKKCKNCNGPFRANHIHAKYCCERCRSYWRYHNIPGFKERRSKQDKKYRQRKQLEKEVKKQHPSIISPEEMERGEEEEWWK